MLSPRPLPTFFATALLALSVSTGGCHPQNTDDGLPILRVYHGDDVKTLDPANAYDSISLDVANSILETLYEFAYLADPFQVVPLLAADLPEFSKDRKTVTIRIKSGVRYHDDKAFGETGGKGRELKAQDFIYAFKRLAHPGLQSQGSWIFADRVLGYQAFADKLAKAPKEKLQQLLLREPIEGLTAVDDLTLQFKLTRPYPQLLSVLTLTFSAPLPPEAIQKYADEQGNLSEHVIGTGPFLLENWQKGKEITLIRNPSYRNDFYPTDAAPSFRKQMLLTDAGKPLPFVERVRIQIQRESEPRWSAFKKGELDLIEVSRDSYAEIIERPGQLKPEWSSRGIRLGVAPETRFSHLSFNMKDPVLGKNKALRQAISSAINREEWNNRILNGRGQKMTSAVPRGITDAPKTARLRFDYDPAKAQLLLRKAGFPHGEGLPTLTLDLRGADQESRVLGELLQKQFESQGIQVTPVYNTFSVFLEKMKLGKLQLSVGAWELDFPDVENVYQLLYGPYQAPGPNEANFDHPVMNRLYEAISQQEPGVTRAELVQKADDLLQEECPWALGLSTVRYELIQPWVSNVRTVGVIPSRYKYIRILPETRKRYLSSH